MQEPVYFADHHWDRACLIGLMENEQLVAMLSMLFEETRCRLEQECYWDQKELAASSRQYLMAQLQTVTR